MNKVFNILLFYILEPKHRAVLSLIPEGENVSTKNYGTIIEIYFKHIKSTFDENSAVCLAYFIFIYYF